MRILAFEYYMHRYSFCIILDLSLSGVFSLQDKQMGAVSSILLHIIFSYTALLQRYSSFTL